MKSKAENKIAVFENKEIRKTFHEGEWWFSVVDVVGALTDSDNPRDYWYKMKIRVKSEDGVELSTNCRQLKLQAFDGKMRSTDCSNTEGIFRLIQSIPSPKAEPLLAAKRMREIYRAKGYSDEWIEKRMRGIKEHKKLEKENLRDHMTDLELIFTMLGEASTTKIAVVKDAQGFSENKVVAKAGGEVAGSARKDLENKIGESIVTNDNFLEEPEKVKRLKRKK